MPQGSFPSWPRAAARRALGDRARDDYTLLPTAAGDHVDNRLSLKARSAFLRHCLHIDEKHLRCPIELDSDEALISAIRPAHHGEGVIVRIERAASRARRAASRDA